MSFYQSILVTEKSHLSHESFHVSSQKTRNWEREIPEITLGGDSEFLVV